MNATDPAVLESMKSLRATCDALEDTAKADAGQSRRHSLIEAWVNVAVGLSVNLAANALLFPLFGWRISAHQNITIGCLYTIISLVRSYLLRRAFNRWHVNTGGIYRGK